MPSKYRYFKDILPNGLRVVTVEAPHLHSAALAVYAKAGSRYETPRNNGLSHFLEHMFFRGSERYPTSYALNEAIEQRGGTLQATTSRDYTCFYLRTHPKLVEGGIEMLGELLRAPRFAQIDIERNIVIEEMLEDYDEDGVDLCVDDLARTAMWPDHPLGYKIVGSRENVARFDAVELHAHREAFYGASNLVFAAVGNVKRASVLRAAKRWLGTLAAGPAVPTVAPDETQDAPRIKLVDADEAQTEIVISFRAFAETDPDYPALQVLRRVLDDGISSRLQKHICEDLGLAYDLGASTECWSDSGAFDIDVTIEKKKSERLVREILGEVRKLRDDAIRPSELEKVLRRYEWDLDFSMDSVSDLSVWFGATELFFEAEPLEHFRERLRAVTLRDLRRVARRVFQPSRLVVAARGPFSSSMKRKVKDAVAEFAV